MGGSGPESGDVAVSARFHRDRHGRLAWRGVAHSGRATMALSVGSRVTLSESWSISGSLQEASDISPARLSLRLLKQDASGSLAGDFSAHSGRRSIPSASVTTRLDRRLTMAGQVRSLASAFGARVTLHGAIDLHMRMDSHDVLGPSWSGGWGSPVTGSDPTSHCPLSPVGRCFSR
jgi:hypothetical protein